jgi:hypothetical protein
VRTYRTLWVLRWLLCALGLTLGVVLVANGVAVIGLLVATMAVLRIAMLTILTRRRRQRSVLASPDRT